MSQKSLIELQNLSFSYDGADLVLKNLSFELNEGKTLGIIGPNGGGKSTLTKILTGQLTPDTGVLKICGQVIGPKDKFPTHKIAYVPQGITIQSCLPLSLLDFVELAMEVSNRQQIADLLCQVELWDRRHELLSELSGGQLQKAVLVHALAQNPQVLILDEPRSALDTNGQDQFLAIVEGLPQKDKMGIILVEHDIHALTRVCDQILCLNKTYHWHDTSELFNNQIMESVYHCELEHLQIHSQFGAGHDHKKCTVHSHSDKKVDTK